VQNGIRACDLVAAVLGKEYIISVFEFLNSLFLEPGKVVFFPPSGKPAML